MRMSNLEGQTLKNASLGAIVTTVFYFFGPLAVIAPIFGGFMAGYLQHHGASGGIKAGGLKGLVMMIPAIGLATIAAGILSGMPMIGGFLSGSILVVVLVVVGHSVAVGLIGGLFGGLLSGGPSRTAEPDAQTTSD
jgi:hypothetical protein